MSFEVSLFWALVRWQGYEAIYELVPIVGDTREGKGYVAIPPNPRPPRRQGWCSPF